MLQPAPPHKLLFLATEDWFFASHFLPMARAARSIGLDVVVATRFNRHRREIENTGARTLDLDMERGEGSAGGPLRALARLVKVLKAERPRIVHAISLRAVLLGGLALRLARSEASLVQAVTGLGVLGADQAFRGRAGRALFRALIRGPLEGRDTHYLFENAEDARWLGLEEASAKATFVAGAGVDPAAFPVMPLPTDDTLRIAVVARMLWSKGVDTAVEAVGLARAQGADVALSLFGAPDPANPRAIPAADLQAWNERPGIVWRGHTGDVATVWREHHVACLPSRGGEGLPRTLLEAASCGRAILTSDVPGCRDLVRDRVEGLLVPPNDPQALAEAMLRLRADRELVGRMGAAAASRIRQGFTEADVEKTVADLYRRVLAG